MTKTNKVYMTREAYCLVGEANRNMKRYRWITYLSIVKYCKTETKENNIIKGWMATLCRRVRDRFSRRRHSR